MTQPMRLQALGGGPSASFEQPFEMLEACHERVHRMLGLLARLREHMCTHGADEQARQAARDVMRGGEHCDYVVGCAPEDRS